MDFLYWKAASGEPPAWDFITNLPNKESMRLIKKLEAYEEYPIDSLWKAEIFKKVEEMIEVRVLLDGQYYRLFGAMEELHCILFYGFVKKSKKIPKKNLTAAKKNFERYKNKK